MRKIGILGGTFDPPHIGHLIIAEEVRYNLNLEQVWFVPTNIPPHKRQASSTTSHRLAMLEKATETNKYFKINNIEMNKNDVSYTIETMTRLKELHRNTEFYFIIGADMVEYLPHWKQIDKLVKMVTFVGVNRMNYTLSTTYPIIDLNTPLINISSSEIRERIKCNKPIMYFLPDGVYTYIKEHQLYDWK